MELNKEFNLYKDIQIRTGGEIYIGVVGPVRTGKSTFIKRFMELLVLPNITGEHDRIRAQDELPQSAGGRTITTTEPKFIPKEAMEIKLNGDISIKVRLVDCVGYMVEGANGHMEEDVERMVKTPWSEQELPFTQAAAIGTKKVINDHSTIGIVVTTDGSFTEIPRESYIKAEERTILELKELRKPFVVLVNSERPYSDEAKRTVDYIEDKYNVTAIPINCEQLKKEDVHNVLEQVLYEFPLSKIEFFMPKWVEMLPGNHPMKQDIIAHIRDLLNRTNVMRDVITTPTLITSEYVKRCKTDSIDMSSGSVRVLLDVDESYYYEMISELIGENIASEYELLQIMREMAKMRGEYGKVLNAVRAVRLKGYGVVTPDKEEITLDKPEVIRHGNKFGVKVKADSPSIFMIRANIETEIAPIVGTESQAEDLIKYIAEADTSGDGIWDTNIFGKTVEQLVNDGISTKIAMIGEDSQIKLQETMQKIVNESNGSIVCIII